MEHLPAQNEVEDSLPRLVTVSGHFLQECGIIGSKSKFCRHDQLLDMFMATGLGYFAQEAPPHNDDHMIMRAGFLEVT